MTVKEKLQMYLDSQVGVDIKTLLAFTIRKTPTLKDDEILDSIDDIKDVISDAIDAVADVYPTDQEAKEAGVRILESVTKLTETPWDDRAVGILRLLLGVKK